MNPVILFWLLVLQVTEKSINSQGRLFESFWIENEIIWKVLYVDLWSDHWRNCWDGQLFRGNGKWSKFKQGFGNGIGSKRNVVKGIWWKGKCGKLFYSSWYPLNLAQYSPLVLSLCSLTKRKQWIFCGWLRGKAALLPSKLPKSRIGWLLKTRTSFKSTTEEMMAGYFRDEVVWKECLYL